MIIDAVAGRAVAQLRARVKTGGQIRTADREGLSP